MIDIGYTFTIEDPNTIANDFRYQVYLGGCLVWIDNKPSCFNKPEQTMERFAARLRELL